jgi:hypothetical protein
MSTTELSEHTTVHGPTARLIDVQEALERAGWTITNISNGGPVGHITVEGDDLVEHLTARWDYLTSPVDAWSD